MKISKSTEQEMLAEKREGFNGRCVSEETQKILDAMDEYGIIKIECSTKEEARHIYLRLKSLFRNRNIGTASKRGNTIYARKNEK